MLSAESGIGANGRGAALIDEEIAPPHLLRAALDHALERIAERELEGIRAAELLGERPTFHDIFEHYRATRFLYSAKLEELGPRLQTIESTWSRLIAADGTVFRMLLRHVVDDDHLIPGTSICAFEFAPACWLVQHLVSARHHELAGTLAVCFGMADWVRRAGCDTSLRLTYRESNPGVARLFGGFHGVVPDPCIETRRCLYALLDAGRAEPPGDRLPEGVRLVEVDARLAPAVVAFYERRGHRVGMRTLHLDDPRATAMTERYRRQGLERTRRVFAALRGERVVGAALCHESSLGMNFSFLENSIELVEVDPQLDAAAAVALVKHLIATGLRARCDGGAGPASLLIDRANAALGHAAGLLPDKPKEYAVMTMRLADGGAEGIRVGILNHYRELFTQLAAREEVAA